MMLLIELASMHRRGYRWCQELTRPSLNPFYVACKYARNTYDVLLHEYIHDLAVIPFSLLNCSTDSIVRHPPTLCDVRASAEVC